MTIQELFKLGMKRDLPELLVPEGDSMLNLGTGNSPIDGVRSLDYPDWDAEFDPIPEATGCVDAIFAFHFLEHLRGDDVVRILRECERVLRPGGVLTVVVPHRLGAMAYQDLDHKTFWTEETWQILMGNPHYDKHRERPWRLRVHANFMMGIVERNLALFTQLVRVDDRADL
jgi:SAM-dependent methyltransferase